MVTRARNGLAAATCVLAVLALVPATASADLNQLLGACSPKDAADNNTTTLELPYRFCDDGIPDVGGRTPNTNADKAVAVPQKYSGAAGLPAKAAADPLTGADANGDIALDIDVTLPTPPATPPTGDKYPLVVMMHGCCAGSKSDWEGRGSHAPPTTNPGTVNDTGERWHYNAAWFASRGYVVLTYSARGFVNGDNKGSTGETQLDSDLYEINDFQHLAGQLVDKGDLDTGAGVVKVDPARIVATGGSYGGGFSWMTLTDPTWNSPGGTPTPMGLVAVAPKYGWTNLIESLVPKGIDPRSGPTPTDPASMSSPLGFAKRSIVAGLYASGKTGIGPNAPHTTFPPEIDAALACLESADPYETSPACVVPLSVTLPRFLAERSAYFESAFFTRVATDSAARVPVFSAGTFSDPLFPASEHRRMVERLKQIIPSYPVQEYYGDYNHFVQNKPKEWGDLCGDDRHVCRYADYPGGNLNDPPPTLKREVGATTRLNRFVDAYAEPPANPSQPDPVQDVTASLQVCPQNTSAAFPGDEPGERFTASTFAGLAPNSLTVTVPGDQQTTFDASPNQNALLADPVGNQLNNSSRCPISQSSGGAATGGPGVATYDSNALGSDFTMIGRTEVTVQHTGAGPATQLNARLYDLFPDGKQVMVDRGFKRITSATGPTVFALNGNGWKFPQGHKVRIELTQDDDPYIKVSNQPSSLALSSVKLDLPVREGSAGVGGTVPPQPSSGSSGGATSGSSGSPGGPSTGRQGTSTRLRVGFGSHVGLVRGGGFYVRCRARGTGRRICEVSVLPRAGASATRRIGFGRAVVRRRSARVRVRLNRRGRRMLRRRPRGLPVTLRMRVRDRSGRSGSASKRARLRSRGRR